MGLPLFHFAEAGGGDGGFIRPGGKLLVGFNRVEYYVIKHQHDPVDGNRFLGDAFRCVIEKTRPGGRQSAISAAGINISAYTACDRGTPFIKAISA